MRGLHDVQVDYMECEHPPCLAHRCRWLPVLAQVAVVQDNAPAVLLDLYLATWSYILAVAGVALLTGWWLWKSIHMRTAHGLWPC